MAIAHKIDLLLCRLRSLKRTSLDGEGMRYLHLSSGVVRAVVTGSGRETVLLSPDPPCTLEHYRSLIALLSPTYRVVAFESPGFGMSMPSSSYDYGLKSGALLIRDVLDATETPSAVLALPCVAGLHALRFAFEFPGRVRAMVVIQSADWGGMLSWVRKIDPFSVMTTPILGQFVSSVAKGIVQKTWFGIAEPDGQASLDYFEQSRKYCRHFCLASALQALRGDDPFLGRKISAPSAILWGEKDRSHSRSDPLAISRYFNEAQLHVVAAGHFPEMTSPERLKSVVDGLINNTL